MNNSAIEWTDEAVERLIHLHEVALGISELTDEDDLEKSEAELYREWEEKYTK